MSAVEIILILLIGAVAIKFGFSFDWNASRERRDEKLRWRARNECPHGRFTTNGDGVAWISYMISPPGTLEWHCRQCGLRAYDELPSIESYERYLRQGPNMAKAWIADDKRYRKTAKKLM